MRTTKKVYFVVCLAAFLVFFSFLSNGSAASKQALIAGICPMTGPVADFSVTGITGMQDAFAYFNKKGGVKGVQLLLKWEDNRYKVPQAISIYKKFLPQNPVGFTLWNSSGAHEALKSFLGADKIPAISIAMSDAQFYPPGWILADGCGYGDQHAAWFDYYRKNMKKSGKIKVGQIGWDSPYGRSGYKEMEKYVATRGGEMVGIEFTTYAPTTVMPQLMRLKEKGVDYIWINCYNTTIDIVLKDMARAGIKAPLVGNSNEPVDGQIKASGAEVTEGYISCHGWYSGDYESDLPQDFIDLMNAGGTRRAGSKNHNVSYSRGWQMGFLFKEGIRLALEKVDFKDLKGEALMNHGFMNMKGFRTPLTNAPSGLDDKEDRRLNPFVRFYQAKSGKCIPVTGWLKAPWLKKEVEGK
ncbi:MAG: ABC transporter substrate-binding protein [Thermodesulfobacteriota bacterium]|nr:ABC transporter substrate-binding protein [Thermodesulfobacteriota bacterium]